MIDYQYIIDKFYPGAGRLRDILLVHSSGVCRMALEVVDRHPELCADRDMVEAGAMLHDIGIIRCNAPGIECHGTEPYICHGTIGARMLREECVTQGSHLSEMGQERWQLSNLGQERWQLPEMGQERWHQSDFGLSASAIEPYARICERHTGTGLTLEQIVAQDLPLPHQDLVPVTIEEQVVCYADKFFSKTHPERQKTYAQALRSLEKFGEAGLVKFAAWHRIFS